MGFVTSFAIRILISAICVLMLSPLYKLETLWLEITLRLGSGLCFGMSYLGSEVFSYVEQLDWRTSIRVRVRDYVCGLMTDINPDRDPGTYISLVTSQTIGLLGSGPGIRQRLQMHLADTFCTVAGVGCRFLGLGSGTMFTVRG